MKKVRWYQPLALAFVVVLWLASVVKAQTLDCQIADQLWNARLYTYAQTAYATLLEQDPQLQCAIDGIESIAKIRSDAIKYYEQGRAYEAGKQLEKARDAYLSALSFDPTFDEANSSLGQVLARLEGQGQSNQFDAVRTLADIGLFSEAAAHLTEVVKENPGVAVPADLQYLTQGNLPIWPSVREWEERWWRPTQEFATFVWSNAIVGLAIIFIMIVFYFRVLPWLAGLGQIHLDIQEFHQGPKDLDLGNGLEAMVEDKIKSGPRPWRIDLIEGDVRSFSIPADAKKVLPSFWVLDMLEWAFPQYVLTVSGSMLISGKKGPGLAVSIIEKRTGRLIDSEVLWHDTWHSPLPDQEKNSAQGYYNLTDEAAKWINQKLWLDI